MKHYIILAIVFLASALLWSTPVIHRVDPKEPEHIAIQQLSMPISRGGRANAATVNPEDADEAFVSSESGGLFHTTDGGDSWQRVLTLPLMRINDVRYAPDSPVGQTIIIAVGWADGHIPNTGGIWRSTDDGATWNRADDWPVDPAQQPCREIYSVYSVSFQGSTGRVYAGTDCGVAISEDWGEHWRHVNMQLDNGRSEQVWSVAAKPTSGVHICTERGHRYATGVDNFAAATNPTDFNGCSWTPHALAISPVETDVVYMTAKVPNPSGVRGICEALFEDTNNGDDGWQRIYSPTCHPGARASFVETVLPRRQRTGFDLYLGIAYRFFLTECEQGGTSRRCPGPWYELVGGQTDRNGVEFDPDTHCPKYVVSDGGVERSLSPDNTTACANAWRLDGIPATGYNALQVYDVAGTSLPDHVDLYAGMQDNNLWASSDGGLTWPHHTGTEGGFTQVPPSALSHDGIGVTYTDFSGDAQVYCDPHYVACRNWNNPPGLRRETPFWADLNPLGQTYIQWNEPVTHTRRLEATYDRGLHWSSVLTYTRNTVARAGWPQISIADDRVIIYQPYKRGNLNNRPHWRFPGDPDYGLRKITGVDIFGNVGTVSDTLANGVTQTLNSIAQYPNGAGSFVWPLVWSVDYRNPNNLLAADIGEPGGVGGGPGYMKISTTGGVTWTVQTQLTNLVTHGGEYRFYIPADEVRADWHVEGWDSMVHVIGYNPLVRNHILVGTEGLGIFQSYDGGLNWELITGTQQITAIDDFSWVSPVEGDNHIYFYVSTYGRGVWKVTVPREPHIYNASADFVNDWSYNTIFDPYTPGIVYRPEDFEVPEPCYACEFQTLTREAILDMVVDETHQLQSLAISGGHFIGSDILGQPIKPALPLVMAGGKQPGAYDGCPVCVDLVSAGYSIRGVVLNKGELVAVIADEKPVLMWAEAIESFDAFLPPEAEYFGPPSPETTTEPYIRLYGTLSRNGQPAVGKGDTVGVFGTGFMSEPDCTAIEVQINGEKLVGGITPEITGEFEIQAVIDQYHGFYNITALQECSGETLMASQLLMVAIVEGGEEEEEEWEGFVYLPLIRNMK